MNKPISLRALITLYELYENHLESAGAWTGGSFPGFLSWISRIQKDNHEGAGDCHHCKIAWSLTKEEQTNAN